MAGFDDVRNVQDKDTGYADKSPENHKNLHLLIYKKIAVPGLKLACS
jgi:hypothetical protein